MKTYKIGKAKGSYKFRLPFNERGKFPRGKVNVTIDGVEKELTIDVSGVMVVPDYKQDGLDFTNNAYTIDTTDGIVIETFKHNFPKRALKTDLPKGVYKLSLTSGNLSFRVPVSMLEIVPVGVIDIWFERYEFPLDIPHEGNITPPRALVTALNIKEPTYVKYEYHEEYGALEIKIHDPKEYRPEVTI